MHACFAASVIGASGPQGAESEWPSPLAMIRQIIVAPHLHSSETSIRHQTKTVELREA